MKAAKPIKLRLLAIRVYLTIRVSTLGFTLLLPLAGSASGKPGWRPLQAAWLIAVAMGFHIYTYVLNDIVDLYIDRSEPLRADSPMVRGEISRRQALVLALVQPPLAFGLALAGKASLIVLAWLLLAFVAMSIYNGYGKRCRWPLVTDAVQAVGWCAMLLMGAWNANPSPPDATWWMTGYVFLCVMIVNGVHGGLRDLANDHYCGARTTALWLGARAGTGNAVLVSRSLTLYAVVLQTGLAVCAIGAAWTFETDAVSWSTLLPVMTALLVTFATLLIAFRYARDRRALVGAGALNIVATVSVLPVLVWPQIGVSGGVVLMAIFGLPILAMWIYNGSHWCLTIKEEPLS